MRLISPNAAGPIRGRRSQKFGSEAPGGVGAIGGGHGGQRGSGPPPRFGVTVSAFYGAAPHKKFQVGYPNSRATQ